MGKELTKIFVHKYSQCTQAARASIRLGFHDATGWSKTAIYGGADTSTLLNDEEIKGDYNDGLEDIRETALTFLKRRNPYGVGAADFVQSVATMVVSCSLGPRIKTYVGKIDNAKSPLIGMVPNYTANAPPSIKLSADKAFSVTDLAVLLGAHTPANQFKVDPKTTGNSSESAQGIWNTRSNSETIANPQIS